MEHISSRARTSISTYIQKPVEFDTFLHALEMPDQYWTVIAKLPPRAV